MPTSRETKEDLSGWSNLVVEYDTKNPIVITDGSKSHKKRNHCTARGWITRDTFLRHLQRTTLRVRKSSGKVLSDSAQVLQCALEELGCEKNLLDPYAYIWDYPDKFYYQSSEPKMLTWWNKAQNIIPIVDPIQLLNLCSKLRTTLKIIVESRQISIRPIKIHSM